MTCFLYFLSISQTQDHLNAIRQQSSGLAERFWVSIPNVHYSIVLVPSQHVMGSWFHVFMVLAGCVLVQVEEEEEEEEVEVGGPRGRSARAEVPIAGWCRPCWLPRTLCSYPASRGGTSWRRSRSDSV